MVWAIKGCQHLSARLERDLLASGQQVVRVPLKMMAWQRRVARTRGESDPIDALAVARAVLCEPTLPVVSHGEASRELKLLVDRRETPVAQWTATINSLLWLVTLEGIVVELALEELEDIITLTARAKTHAKRIAELTAQTAPTLLTMPGVGALTAVKLVGESAGASRVHSEAAFARHAGVAPIPVWSGNTAGRVRMTRSGNRQLNAALHRIAITQVRLDGSLGKTYYEKKKAEGMSNREALRCLKRRLARVVFHHLTTDQALASTSLAAAA